MIPCYFFLKITFKTSYKIAKVHPPSWKWDNKSHVGVARSKTSSWCPDLFSFIRKQKNMAELLRMICCITIAFVVNFPFRDRCTAQSNTKATSTIQFTASSSQSVDVLSSLSPTKATPTSCLPGNTVGLSDLECPDGVKCSDLGASCIKCNFSEFNFSCIYGEDVEVNCSTICSVNCSVRILFYTVSFEHSQHYEF